MAGTWGRVWGIFSCSVPVQTRGSFCGIFSRYVSLDVSVNVRWGLWDLILLCPCPNAGQLLWDLFPFPISGYECGTGFRGSFPLFVHECLNVGRGLWDLFLLCPCPNAGQLLWDLFLLSISVRVCERGTGFGDLFLSLSMHGVCWIISCSVPVQRQGSICGIFSRSLSLAMNVGQDLEDLFLSLSMHV